MNCSNKQHKPFITSEIRQAKALRSRLETVYRRSKTSINRENYKKQSHLLSKLITNSKRQYFRDLISCSKHNSKKLWSTLTSLLYRTSRSGLPSFASSKSMVSTFIKFFFDKVAVLHSKLNPVIVKMYKAYC